MRAGFLILLAGCAGAPLMEMAPQEKSDGQDGRKVLPIEVVSRHRVEGVPWADPGHAAWNEAPVATVKLIPQQVQEPKLAVASIGELRVRSLYGKDWIGFLLEWEDSTFSATLRSDRFGDGAAVEFPLAIDPLPDYRMGDEGRPVQLLLWRAERQRALEEKISFLEENYPNAWSDGYPFEPTAVGFVPDPAMTAEQKKYVAAHAAENPFRIGVAPPVEDLGAQTWNKLTRHRSQDGRGRGVWAEGRWRVVIARPLATADAEDALLAGKDSWPVAFAAWDGGRQNVGPRKMVTEGWIRVRFQR